MIAVNLVKPFILHSEQVVRQFAVNYFQESYHKDPEIMHLVLESCQRYPEEESRLRLLSLAFEFVQTPQSLAELQTYIKQDPRNRDTYEQIIAYSDLKLLDSFDLSTLLPYTQKIIDQRREVANIPTDELWQKLLEHSASAADTDPSTYDLNLGIFMIKELAVRSDFNSSKVLERLNFPFGINYEGYDEVYLSMLAGELRLTQAIPLLIKKLASDDQLLIQSAQEALIKIGSLEVIEKLAAAFADAERDLQVVISAILGQIKLEASETLALRLLKDELSRLSEGVTENLPQPNEEAEAEDFAHLTVATNLARSLCSLLSRDGIPLVKQLIEHGYDPAITMLEENLYTCCLITGVQLPELKHYRQLIEEETERYRQAKLAAFKLFNQNVKIGRNDPCPCGSGKKYKKCCGANK